MPHLQLTNTSELHALISKRTGETKIGEKLQLVNEETIAAALPSFNGKFVIIGIPEDIGVRANGGIGGAQTGWKPFLKSFVNLQETQLLSGHDFLVLGAVNFEDWLKDCDNADIETLRTYTAKIDDLITPIIQNIISHNKIPIVIGGGHNNAYPLLKGLSLAKGSTVNVINSDAHSDFRVKEGRHSGNGFRYAYEDGYLKKYAILGLHQAYNSENIVDLLISNPDFSPLFFEDLFLRNKMDWNEAIQHSLNFVEAKSFGVELDVDCIENVLSSAATPVGISTQQALLYLYKSGLNKNAAYLHLPEGISVRADGLEDGFTGKLLSYLLQAFCRGVLDR
jgi:formiminoglutamase